MPQRKRFAIQCHEFFRFSSAANLAFDSSFQFFNSPDAFVQTRIADTAAAFYLSGAVAQVIVPLNDRISTSVCALNQAIQERVNPHRVGKLSLSYNNITFRDEDRVIITKNSPDGSLCNGDVGTLSIFCPYTGAPAQYRIRLKDGRYTPVTSSPDQFASLTLAYAITVHKSQGNEYDTILMPVTSDSRFMMSQNFFYTAISRAKKQARCCTRVLDCRIFWTFCTPPSRSLPQQMQEGALYIDLVSSIYLTQRRISASVKQRYTDPPPLPS